MAEEFSQIKEKLQELQVLQQLDDEQDEIRKMENDEIIMDHNEEIIMDHNDEIIMDHNDDLKKLMEDVGINYEPTDYTETEEEDMFQ